jgi:methyl-accepting chemotaxis protein
MSLGRLSVRTKLAILLGLAMVLLAGTRGLGLAQLGGFLDRLNGYTESLDGLHQQLDAVQESRVADASAGRVDAASQAAYQAKIGELRAQLNAKRAEIAQVQQRERSIMYSTYVAMLVLIFIVGGGIYWLLMALVVRPLQGMASVANVIAAGDLSTEIKVKSADEIGKVMQALHDMNASLGALIGKIRGISQSIEGSTGQISATSDSLSRQVEAQAAALQKTAATMQDLTATVARNADNAGRARELAATARDVAMKGGAEVGAAVKTMADIGNSSRKIVDIVSIIDGITFQTNILALNAAVEAARAGEQGRGFAVVAAEVRSLAQRSTEAAKEIAALINESVDGLRHGGDLVSKAGGTMTEIVDAARAVDDIMAEIASASAQQRREIERVRETVHQIDHTSQQQALLVHAAEATLSMQQQAQELIAAVSAFRLRAGQVEQTPIPIARQPAGSRRRLLSSPNVR